MSRHCSRAYESWRYFRFCYREGSSVQIARASEMRNAKKLFFSCSVLSTHIYSIATRPFTNFPTHSISVDFNDFSVKFLGETGSKTAHWFTLRLVVLATVSFLLLCSRSHFVRGQ